MGKSYFTTTSSADQLIYCISTIKFVDFHCPFRGDVAKPYISVLFSFGGDAPRDLCDCFLRKNSNPNMQNKSRADYDFIFI